MQSRAVAGALCLVGPDCLGLRPTHTGKSPSFSGCLSEKKNRDDYLHDCYVIHVIHCYDVISIIYYSHVMHDILLLLVVIISLPL